MSDTIYKLYWIHLPEHTNPFTEGYVGVTSRTIEKRLQEHHRERDLPDGCVITQITTGDKSFILEMENTFRPEPDIGWNRRSGGHHGTQHNDETKQRWSEVRKGKTSHRKGGTLSEEHRKKISATMKGRPSHWKGKKFSDEHRRKMSEAQRRRHGAL